MGSVKRFAAINTKIRALEGRLLTGDDYENLLDMSSLSEMISYLKSKTSYVHHLEEIDPDNAIIDHLEVVFRKSYLCAYKPSSIISSMTIETL